MPPYINRLFDDYSAEEVAALEADFVRLYEAVITARNEGNENSDDKIDEDG
jgi:hypothetical protein